MDTGRDKYDEIGSFDDDDEGTRNSYASNRCWTISSSSEDGDVGERELRSDIVSSFDEGDVLFNPTQFLVKQE
jgi:hypothetical protein